ncbi:MAG: Fe-S cluster assembly sulfur transfer protein SufU [Acetobacteraceae bacterium]
MFDDLRDLYQDVILDRARHPRHGRRLAAFDATAEADNPMCGDRVRVWIARDAEGRLGEVGFEGRGCAISLASADLMAEAVIGKDAPAAREAAARFESLARSGTPAGDDPAFAALGVFAGVAEFPSRVKCATLPWGALVAALGDGA